MVITLLLVMEFAFAVTANRWHIDKRHQWFVQEERKIYDEMLQKIMQHKSALEAQPRSLQDIVRRPDGVYGRTNPDGSMLVLFPGGEGGSRHGYLYYSGGQLAANPVHEGEPFIRLTNGWYEY